MRVVKYFGEYEGVDWGKFQWGYPIEYGLYKNFIIDGIKLYYMKVKHLSMLVVASLMLTACPTGDFTSTYTCIVNNSDHNISVYWASTAANTSAYPDTLLPDNPVPCGADMYELIESPISPNGGLATFEYPTNLKGFKKLFNRKEHLPEGILSVFVMHTDTLLSYPWEQMKANNKYLVRYDLYYEDIIRFSAVNDGYEFHIPFPPTEAMRDMKMWPPYEEVKKKYIHNDVN